MGCKATWENAYFSACRPLGLPTFLLVILRAQPEGSHHPKDLLAAVLACVPLRGQIRHFVQDDGGSGWHVAGKDKTSWLT